MDEFVAYWRKTVEPLLEAYDQAMSSFNEQYASYQTSYSYSGDGQWDQSYNGGDWNNSDYQWSSYADSGYDWNDSQYASSWSTD